MTTELWKWYEASGKLSPKHSFTIVNANDTFCTYFEEADKFIKEKLKKLNVKIEYGWNLVEVI